MQAQGKFYVDHAVIAFPDGRAIQVARHALVNSADGVYALKEGARFDRLTTKPRPEGDFKVEVPQAVISRIPAVSSASL
jgi:hypothetical protein